jgi:RNA polymerase sigma-70 factor (ECF subfamily)
MDVCQSVLASFFVRAAAGQYDLDCPDDLIRLLVRMARNKVVSQARKIWARAADRDRVPAGDLETVGVTGPSASSIVADGELLGQVRGRMTTEERQIADLRGQGFSWPEIAAHIGGTAEARRKQLTRTLDLIARQLGIDEADDAAA